MRNLVGPGTEVIDAEVEIVDFDDARVKGEPPRRFVVTRTRTARKTPVNVNAYFQPYGEHLFYSVRSYTVPRLNLSRLLQTLWMLLLITLSLAVVQEMAAPGVATRSDYDRYERRRGAA